MYKPSILVETTKKYIQTKYHAPFPHRVSKYEAKRHKRKRHGVLCLILQTPESVAPLFPTERVSTKQNAFSREVDYLRHIAFHY